MSSGATVSSWTSTLAWKRSIPSSASLSSHPRNQWAVRWGQGVGHVCIVHIDRAVADSSFLFFSFFFFNHINVCDVCVIHIDCSVGDSSSLFFSLFFFSYLFLVCCQAHQWGAFIWKNNHQSITKPEWELLCVVRNVSAQHLRTLIATSAATSSQNCTWNWLLYLHQSNTESLIFVTVLKIILMIIIKISVAQYHWLNSLTAHYSKTNGLQVR